MKDNIENIEKLFRDSLDGFESDVDPNLWSNIASKIGPQAPVQDPSSVSSAGSSSGVSGGVGVGIGATKIALIVATAGLITFGGYVLLSDDDNEAVNEVSTELSAPKTKSEVETSPETFEHKVIPYEAVDNAIEVDILNEEEPEISQQNVVSNSVSKTTQNNIAPSTQEKAVVNKKVENVAANNVDKKSDAQKQSEKPVENSTIEKVPAIENSRESEIEKRDIFEVSIYASVKSGKQPLEVYFENQGTYTENLVWKFRDGQETKGQNVSHTFEKSGSYWVILEAKSSDGRLSKDSTKITVEGKAYIKAGNTFSPNGDGINDAFMVESDYIESFKCTILDRSQNVIYEWNSIYGHWDGRDLHNSPVPVGTYFYVIEAVDMDGNKLPMNKGVVQLFR